MGPLGPAASRSGLAEFEAAGPDFKAAGPDFEAAGTDFEAAGPDLEAQFGPEPLGGSGLGSRIFAH